VPRARKVGAIAFTAEDPAFWFDAEGEGWRPVLAEDGSWGKTRSRL
jgi:hypothetical protein